MWSFTTYVFLGNIAVSVWLGMSTARFFQTQGFEFLLPGRSPHEEMMSAIGWAACLALNSALPRWLEDRLAQHQLGFPRRLPPGQGVGPEDGLIQSKTLEHLQRYCIYFSIYFIHIRKLWNIDMNLLYYVFTIMNHFIFQIPKQSPLQRVLCQCRLLPQRSPLSQFQPRQIPPLFHHKSVWVSLFILLNFKV